MPMPALAALALAPPAQSATLAVSPAFAPGGSPVTARGAGYAPRRRALIRVPGTASVRVRANSRGRFSATLAAPVAAGRRDVRTRRGPRTPLSVLGGAGPALSASVGWSGGARLVMFSTSGTRVRVLGSGFRRRDRAVRIRQSSGRRVTLRVRSRGRVSGSLRLRARAGAEPTLVVVARRRRVSVRLRRPRPPAAAGQPAPVAETGPLLVAAGDVACAPGDTRACQQATTGQLVQSLNPAAVAALGDLQYETGTLAEFRASFDPTWGRFKGLIRPIPGNHEYETPDAAGYFEYFGAAAGAPATGYYSYDLGTWHVIALNSSDRCMFVSCAVGSAQERWLRADLAANPRACVLAYVHQPRFSSGVAGGGETVTAIWRALYEAGADVVLAGHDHIYERFAPQDPDGRNDPARGLRSFVVGSGGAYHSPLMATQPNSEARDNTTFGVLALTLRPTGYDWRFVPVPGGAFTDAGSGACH